MQYGIWMYAENKKTTLISSFSLHSDMDHNYDSSSRTERPTNAQVCPQLLPFLDEEDFGPGKAEMAHVEEVKEDNTEASQGKILDTQANQEKIKPSGNSLHSMNKENISESTHIKSIELNLGIIAKKRGRGGRKSILRELNGSNGGLVGKK